MAAGAEKVLVAAEGAGAEMVGVDWKTEPL